MLHSLSYQFTHKVNTLKSNLAQISRTYDIKDIYITEKCLAVVQSYLQECQIYQCGYQKVISRQNISPYLNVARIVVLMNISGTDLKQIQQYNQLFPQMYVLTLTFTNQSNYKRLKESPLRAQIKKIKQIPLNFMAHLDYLYYLKQKNSNQKTISFCSYLVSLQKLAEFQIYYHKENSQTVIPEVESIKQELEKCIQLMQKHKYKSYDQKSSPRTKVLILNRQAVGDYASPLIYNYYYGSWMEQIYSKATSDMNEKHLGQFLNPKARILNKIWDMDLLQASKYIVQNLLVQKVVINDPFEANYCYKVKQVMSQSNKPNPLQVVAHIQIHKKIKQRADKKQQAAQLQQDIANSLNVFQQKLSNGDCISQINKWLLNGKNVTQQEYFKMAMIAFCTHDFWFFHRSSLRSPLQNNFKILYKRFEQRYKTKKRISLIQKCQDQNPFALQKQKEERFALFRHEPKIVQICRNWIQSVSKKFQQANQFKKIQINSSLKNRENKYVIYMSNQLGYNQAVLLRRMLKEKTNKEVSIVCNRLVNTSTYAKILCEEQAQKKDFKNRNQQMKVTN